MICTTTMRPGSFRVSQIREMVDQMRNAQNYSTLCRATILSKMGPIIPLRDCIAVSQIREMEDQMRNAQNYSTMVQSYNQGLQNDVNDEKSRRAELEKARDTLQAQCVELGGAVRTLEQMLQFEKVRMRL